MSCPNTWNYCPTQGITSKNVSNMASKTNPLAFLQQVRAEVSKVVWPSRRDTMVTTVMVLILVFMAAIFFLAVDQVLGFGVGLLLGSGS